MSNCHVWIKIKDPSDIVRVRTAAIVKASEEGLAWLKPKHDRKTGEICSHSLTTVFDTSVFTPGRLVFVGAPSAGKGFKVNDPEFYVSKGIFDSSVDTSVLKLPSPDEVRRITKNAGVEMHISGNNGDLRVTVNDLSYETELETQRNGVITVAEAIEIGGTIRCQSPFRESSSWAALFSVGSNGKPLVYDFGTATTHRVINDASHDFDVLQDFDTVDLEQRSVDEIKWSHGEAPFTLHSPSELFSAAPISWLIKGVLPSNGLGVLYGESGSGKTFITLDMAIHLARGADWQGKRTKQAGVLYLAAEGAAGLSLRLRAYSVKHELDLTELPLLAITEPANLLEKGAKRLYNTCLMASQRLDRQVKLIIIDTLNRSMPGGDENSSQDMSTVIDRVAKMGQALKAFVLIIHHSGKDASKGARGHSSLRAAVDVELEVKRDGEIRTLTLTKSRDGQDGVQFANKLEIVSLGYDEDHDEITSCVAVSGLLSDAASKKPKPQGKWQEAVSIAVNEALTAAVFNDNPNQVSVDDVLKQLESIPNKAVRWKESAKQALNDLVAKGLITQKGSVLWLS